MTNGQIEDLVAERESRWLADGTRLVPKPGN